MITGASAPVAGRPEVCSRCGTGFYCGARFDETQDKCWCATLPVRAAAPDPAAGCLCQNCLRAELRAAGLLEPEAGQ